MEVSCASKGAIEAVEAAGGTVTAVHFNRLALRAALQPYKFTYYPLRARYDWCAVTIKQRIFYIIFHRRKLFNYSFISCILTSSLLHWKVVFISNPTFFPLSHVRPPPKIMNLYLDKSKCGYLSPEIQIRNTKLFGCITSVRSYMLFGYSFDYPFCFPWIF